MRLITVRSEIVRIFKERLPIANVDVDLLTDQQILVLLVNEDLKDKNLSYQQIQNKYGISYQTARTIKFIVVNRIVKTC